MSVFFNLSAALDGHLETLSGAPDIAWPNSQYEPAIGSSWVRPTLLPGDTAAATLGASGTDEQIGIYQVDVFTPLGAGKTAAFQLADSIAEHFKPVTELTYSGQMVRCVSVSIGAPEEAEGWYMLPVRINYLSFTAKR